MYSLRLLSHLYDISFNLFTFFITLDNNSLFLFPFINVHIINLILSVVVIEGGRYKSQGGSGD